MFRSVKKLPRSAVLWTLLPDNRKVSIKLLRSAVFLWFFLLCWKMYRSVKKLLRSAVLWTLSTDNWKVSIKLPRSAILWTPGIKMSSDNRKVSIKLLRSAVFVILSSDNRKVSTKLPRSGSILDIENVSIKLLRSAVLSTQKCVHRTAKVRSFMDTLKYCHIWQESPSVLPMWAPFMPKWR